jgi:hypothetical protein
MYLQRVPEYLVVDGTRPLMTFMAMIPVTRGDL